jgi:hypothetical protein
MREGGGRGARRTKRGRGVRRAALALLVAVAFGCEPSAGVRCAAVAAGSPEVTADAPFAIELVLVGSASLRASLRNRSTSAQRVLHDPLRQPSRLLLRGPGGEVPSFDTRSVMKFDNTVETEDYAVLEPGGSVPLGEASFERSGIGWRIRWGPFEFEDLRAGAYEARVAFSSERADAVDPESGEAARVTGVWLGRVESPAVRVTLSD